MNQEASTDKPTDKKSDANNNNDIVEKATTVTSTTDHRKQTDSHFADEQDRKLFIGYPANSSFNEETFKDFFKKFGDVEKMIIKRDQMTGKPRGFGFLTMSTAEEVQKIIEACPIEIKGRQVECKLAISRPITKKIFVGGIDSNLTKEQITDYFKSYGKVEDLELPYDRVNKKRREFCFVIFETEEEANLASKQPKQLIHGKECDVKKATPQPIAQQQKRQNLHQSFNSSQSNQYANLNHSKNSRNYYPSPNSIKSNGSYEPYNQRNYRKNNFNRNYPVSNDGESKNSEFEHETRGAKPLSVRQRAWVNPNVPASMCVPVSNHTKTFNRNYGYYNGKEADPNQKAYSKDRRERRGRPGQVVYKERDETINNYAFAGKQLTNQNYANYDQMVPQNGYYNYQYPCDMYQVAGQNYQSIPQNTPAYMSPNIEYYQQYYQQYYQNPASTIPQAPQYATNQCYTNYQSANSVDTNTALQQQPTTGTADTYQSLDEQYYAEQQKYDNELLNNQNYEKFDAQEANYGGQPVNTNLLNVQQYQSSIQQC